MDQAVKVYGKTLQETYNDNRHNYIAENEITVTITLAEYRELITSHATKQSVLDEMRHAGYKKDVEISELKSRIERLLSMCHSGITGTTKDAEV